MEEFEQIAEERDASKAETARILLRAGMEEERKQNIENTIQDIDEALRADGGVPTRAEIKRLQNAMTLQTVSLGSAVLLASALSAITLPVSAILIFGIIVLIMIGFTAYRQLGVITNGDTTALSAPSEERQ
jgi:hypothetical protein